MALSRYKNASFEIAMIELILYHRGCFLFVLEKQPL